MSSPQPIPSPTSQPPGFLGTELLTIGGSLSGAGMTLIAASSAALPDTVVGSPRSIGIALGAAVAAIGAIFVSVGSFLHARGR